MTELKNTLEGYHGYTRVYEGGLEKLFGLHWMRMAYVFWYLIRTTALFWIPIGMIIILGFNIYDLCINFTGKGLVGLIVVTFLIITAFGFYVKIISILDNKKDIISIFLAKKNVNLIAVISILNMRKNQKTDIWGYTAFDIKHKKWKDRTFTLSEILDTANVPEVVINRYNMVMEMELLENYAKEWNVYAAHAKGIFTYKKKLIEKVFFKRDTHALVLKLEDNTEFLIAKWNPSTVKQKITDLNQAEKLSI